MTYTDPTATPDHLWHLHQILTQPWPEPGQLQREVDEAKQMADERRAKEAKALERMNQRRKAG